MIRLAGNTLHRIFALVVAASLISCADPRAELKPVPIPDASAFEPSVRNAVTTARATFDRIVAEKPDDAKLAAAYGELAMTYHAQDLVAPAEIAYANAHLLAPRDKRWPYLLGHVYNDASRVPEAIQAFESVLSIDRNDAPTLQVLGQVYLQQGEFDKAQTLFERLLVDKNARAAGLAGLGKVALARRDYRAAIDRFEEALKLWPAASRLRQPLAMAYQGIGDRAKADENLKQFAVGDGEPAVDDPIADALGDKVAASKVLLRRGQRFGKAARFDLAEKAFRAAVAADPNDPEALANLGISLANLGRIREAEESLTKALAMDDTNAVAHISLAVVYDRQGRDQAAIDQYVAALAHDPENAQARVYLADAKMRTGKPAEAAQLYREALDKSPASGRMQYSLAMADIKAGRYADARKILEAALEMNPGNQLFANALARILATAPDASVRDGPRALQMAKALFEATRSPDVGVTYAMAFAQNGNFEEATKLQRETIIAFERSKMPISKPFLERNLALYQRREPSREGWATDDPAFSPRAPAVRVAGEARGS
jgi:tetratricopeptide (TPR) repeat protein